MRLSLSALLTTLVLIVSSIVFVPAATATMEYNQWIPIPEGESFTSCSGEEVVVTGEQHIVGQAILENDGQEHFVFHRNTYGTGIGTVSGADYLLLDTVAKTDLVGTHEGGVTVFNQLTVELMIRKGETAPHDDNFVQIMTRYTILPDGTLTGEIDIISSSCR